MDDLLREFVGETLDMMDAVAGDLVAWEADPADRSGLDGIFRTVHTVKGSSGFFDCPRITALAHAAEELLDVLRSRKSAPSRASVATVLIAFDRIRELTQAIAATGKEPDGTDARLIAAVLADVRSEDRDGLAADLPLLVPAEATPTPGDAETVGDVPLAWRSVRVPVELLDEVMSGVSDLVLSRNEVAAQLRGLGIDPVELAAFDRLSQLLVNVRTSVSHMRMVPLRHLYAPLPRLVRLVADELGKAVRLDLSGSEVEIDREVIEALRDPVMHLLRNAIDHGLESVKERVSAGKDRTGRISMSARQAGNRIQIELSDDGAGLALDRLVDRAIAAGQLTSVQAALLTDERKAELVFLPGLSTADQVTGISGRGVGMDVVKANIERLGGAIRIINRPGAGVTLTLDVPMTLTIISALAIDVGGQCFAIPRSAIEEVMLASSDVVQLHAAGGTGLVRVRGRVLPLLTIEAVLGLPLPDGGEHEGDRALLLCRIGAAQTIALNVPEVRDHEELVIKPLPPVLLSLGLYSGLSLPDNGQPMLVLDIEAMAAGQGILADPGQMFADDVAIEAGNQDDTMAWLTFRQVEGGRLMAVPMATVERISDVAVSALSESAGRLLAHIDATLIPVAVDGFDIPVEGKVRMIRIGDGERAMLLPVNEISHVLDLTIELLPTASTTGLVGTALFDGKPIDLIDVYSMLVEIGRVVRSHDIDGSMSGKLPQHSDSRLLWLVDRAGGEWAGGFLIPSLTAAGFKVNLVNDRGLVPAGATHVLTMAASGHADPLSVEVGNKVHQLSAYDRPGLITLLATTPGKSPKSRTRANGASS